jgi:hypothetical protein
MGLNGGGQRLIKSRSSAPKSSLIFTPDEACWIPTRTQHEALTQAAGAFGGVFLHRPIERHIHHFGGLLFQEIDRKAPLSVHKVLGVFHIN